MQLDDVRAALHERAATVPAASIDPGAALTRTRRTVRRRRIGQTSFALGLVIAIVGGVVALATGHTAKDDRVVVGSPTTTTRATTKTTTTVAAKPGDVITDEQMRAHLGDGVPAGWVPVDEGDVRLFVPPDWLDPGNGCIGDPSATGMVLVGGSQQGCLPRSQYPVPVNAVSISGALPSDAKVVRTVHGYHLAISDVAHAASVPPWTFYNVPALDAEVGVRGASADRILATLAPSAEKVVRSLAPQISVPTGRVVSIDGVRMTIPAAWAVAPAHTGFCNWPVSDTGTPELVQVSPDDPALPCPPPMPTASGAVHDGVFVDTVTVANIPSDRSGPPFLVLHHGPTTVSLKGDLDDPNTLDVYAQLSGSSTIHSMRIGLGRDGHVAAGIIASIEATA